MSLYNMLFGRNKDADLLLLMLGLAREDTGRFRDAFLHKEGDETLIAIYTRNGGNNRPDYFPEWLTAHPLYVRDADDDFDNTYCTIFFRLPNEVPEAFKKAAAEAVEPFDPDKRWAEMLDSIRKASPP